MENKERFKGKTVGLVVSGGNIDSRLLSSVLMRGLVREGRMVRLRIEITDIPGALSTELIGVYPHVVLLEILGEEGVIGFVLFVSIVLVSVRQAKRFKAVTILSKEAKKVYAANFGCLIYTLLLSFKQGSLINSPEIFLFAIISEKYFYLIKRE